jgi:hypothetical protein
MQLPRQERSVRNCRPGLQHLKPHSPRIPTISFPFSRSLCVHLRLLSVTQLPSAPTMTHGRELGWLVYAAESTIRHYQQTTEIYVR